MKIGYGRTSTLRQDAGLEAQLKAFEAEGCGEYYSEKVSSAEPRAQLEAAIRALRKGDVLVVTKLDRLARSVRDAVELEQRIAARGAALKVLDPAIDTSTPIGKLMFNLLASIAQFEREIMLERQREGIARAQAEGKYKGRRPTARVKTGRVLELLSAGMGTAEVAEQVGIGRASVYRIAKDAGWETGLRPGGRVAA
jgi:DNA invertase Pin-like site-specific DNA recombinase